MKYGGGPQETPTLLAVSGRRVALEILFPVMGRGVIKGERGGLRNQPRCPPPNSPNTHASPPSTVTGDCRMVVTPVIL